MRKTKLALTALMIGAMTVTGASFAEAGLKVDDVKIVIGEIGRASCRERV